MPGIICVRHRSKRSAQNPEVQRASPKASGSTFANGFFSDAKMFCERQNNIANRAKNKFGFTPALPLPLSPGEREHRLDVADESNVFRVIAAFWLLGKKATRTIRSFRSHQTQGAFP